MALVCNINRRGRWVRVVFGLVSLAIGVMMIAAAWPEVAFWQWLVGAAFAVCGLFSVIVGGAAGWCVCRALGWKTPV